MKLLRMSSIQAMRRCNEAGSLYSPPEIPNFKVGVNCPSDVAKRSVCVSKKTKDTERIERMFKYVKKFEKDDDVDFLVSRHLAVDDTRNVTIEVKRFYASEDIEIIYTNNALIVGVPGNVDIWDARSIAQVDIDQSIIKSGNDMNKSQIDMMINDIRAALSRWPNDWSGDPPIPLDNPRYVKMKI